MKRLVPLAAALLVLLATATPAHALDRTLELLAPAGMTTPADNFVGLSPNGKVKYFETADALSTDDTDAVRDVYAFSGASTKLMSDRAQPGPDAAEAARFRGSSTNGAVVAFVTKEPLVAADGDAAQDIYVRAGATTTIVSDRVQAGSETNDVPTFAAISADGSRVLFGTDEPLVADDGDSSQDVYLFDSGTLHLLSDRAQAGADAERDVLIGTAIDDVRGAVITTSEPLSFLDGDSHIDLYSVAFNNLELISKRVKSGTDAAVDAQFDDATPDGRTIAFSTTEPIVNADGDVAGRDVYVFHLGERTLASDAVQGSDQELDANTALLTDDGATVFFNTPEALLSEDGDASSDVYRHNADGTALMSDRVKSGADATQPANAQAVTADGRVVFATAEPLVDADGDTAQDLYVGGTPAPVLVSDSLGADGPLGAAFVDVGGNSIFFTASDPLVAADDDSSQDVYVVDDDGLRLLSDGVHSGADPNTSANLTAIAPDGRTLVINTAEPLLPADGNAVTDVYLVAPGPPATPPAPDPPADGGDAPAAPGPPTGDAPPAGGQVSPPPASTADLIAPALSGLSISPKKVTAGKQATVRLTLSEPAKVTLAFVRREAGRKGKGGKCVKPTRKNRKAKKCTRLVSAGSIKLTGKTGANTARTSKKLKVGSYDVTATAVDAAGNKSPSRSARFSVIKKRRE